jgi:hypothetical protein
MKYDYNAVRSVDEDEFSRHRRSDDEITKNFTIADSEEVKRMERLLDAPEGSLGACGPYCLQHTNCQNCGRTLTMYDFVLTALVDADHPKAFVFQVLTGDKKVVQTARRVRCSCCATTAAKAVQYHCGAYACDDPPKP